MNAPTRDAVSWREQAACATETADWWDLVGGDGPNAEGKLTEANRAAIRICAGCPVARECFKEGLDLSDRGVVRGGIPLFKPMERHRCEKCGRGFLRVISAGKGSDRRRRNCEACRRPVGVHLSQRECTRCGGMFAPVASNRRSSCSPCQWEQRKESERRQEVAA